MRPLAETEEEEEEECKSKRAKCECGKMPITVTGLRIINGEDASPGEFPYHVMVLTMTGNRMNTCGGSIIKKQWVLTAAHCFYGKDKIRASSVTVMGGSIFRDKIYELHSDRVFHHEDFRSPSQGDDVALIHLSEEIDFAQNPKLKPICLGRMRDIPYGGMVVATGWGKVIGKETMTNTLQEVALDVISTRECASLMESRLPNDTNKIMCAMTPNKDTCQGDSGGPLVAQMSDGRWAQVGITSYGLGCSLPDKPGVYVNVAHYLPWIMEKTGACTC
ncbi:hypothetical protein O3P69_001234 [Scylla paramamosain]|uniref:limulus clotting factor C n=1 Tax=Scylla paramamosain TaxID=85552 RepID=A0AAW0UPP3_SCYPA